MDFQTYQSKAAETAIYPDQGHDHGLAYVALGLAGEAGEFANKVKKVLRDGWVTPNATDIAAELGDVLWYVAMACAELGVSMEQIAAINLAKLNSRKARGVLGGSGDNR